MNWNIFGTFYRNILTYSTEDGGTHCVECPVKTLFTVPLSEKSGQEKNQCLFCDHIILRNFSNRLMYFLGNDKNGGG
jgi:hypothetical protein